MKLIELLDAYRTCSEPRYTGADFRRVMTDPDDLHWIGGISRITTRPDGRRDYVPKLGTFWMPAILDPAVNPGVDTKEWKVAKGIGRDAVLAQPCLFAEMDEGTIEQQLQRLLDVVKLGCPAPTAVVLSGDSRNPDLPSGKSVHIFWRLSGSYYKPDEEDAWRRIQKALQVVFDGDESISDICRRMRWGCGATYQAGPFSENFEPRVQTILWLGERIDRDDMASWAAGISIPNPPQAVRASGGGTRGRSGLNASRQQKDFSAVVADGGTLAALGASLQPGGKLPLRCPFHDDRAASAFVSRNDTGSLYLFCSACGGGTTYWDTGSSQGPSRPSQAPRGAVPSTGPTAGTILREPDLFRKRYIPHRDFAPGVSIGLRGPKGTGKNQWAAWLVGETLQAEPSAQIIAVAHSRGLVAGLSVRLQLPHYIDDHGEHGAIQGSTAICVNSVRRILLHRIEPIGETHLGEPVAVEPDLLIIDEIESVLQAVAPGTMGPHEAQQVHEQLADLVAAAKRVIVLDADLSEYSLDWLRRHRPQADIHIVDVQVPVPWEYEFTHDRADWTGELLSEWRAGKRLAIAMTSRWGTKRIGKLLREARPDARVAIVNKDTARDYDLGAINTWAGNYDAIVYSPTMGTGVSIDIGNHFDRIYGWATHHTLTAQGVHQMLHRVRHPNDNRILVYAPRGGTTKTTDPKAIREQILRQEWETTRRSKRAGILKEMAPQLFRYEEGRRVRHVEGENYLDHYCETLAYQRACGVFAIGSALLRYLQGLTTYQPVHVRGATTMTEEEKAEVSTQVKRANEEVFEEEVAEHLHAADMPLHRARALREPKSRAEFLARDKALRTDFYGEDSEEIVRFDLKGGRKRARALARLQVAMDGDEETLLAGDARALADGVPAPHLRHDHLTALGLLRVFSWVGLIERQVPEGGPHFPFGSTDLGKCGPPWTWTTGTLDAGRLAAAARRCAMHRKELALLGIEVPAAVTKSPVQFLGHLLRRVGLKLTCRRPRTASGRVRVYALDTDVLSRMGHLGARCYERIAAGDLDGEGEVQLLDATPAQVRRLLLEVAA